MTSDSNIEKCLKELNLNSYDELYSWSINSREEFWSHVIKKLNIKFSKNPEKILDTSKGIENPQWLKNAELNIVDSCFQSEPEQTAIIYADENSEIKTLSYQELEKLTNQIAHSLKAKFETGDHIAVYMPMTAESVALYLGIIKAGMVVVSTADSFAPQEIQTRLDITKAAGIFTYKSFQRAGKTIELASKLENIKIERIIIDNKDWSGFLKKEESKDSVNSKPETHTNILFSSGTTGEPKAIPWTQTTPIKCASDAYFHHNIMPGDILCWPTNLGWMMGPWLIYAALINRASIALYYGAPTGKDFGKFVQNTKTTMLGLVPSLVRNWKASGCMDELAWSAIKVFSSTGECSNPEEMSWLSKLPGKTTPIIEYCGGTEIGGGYITSTVVQDNQAAQFSTAALGSSFKILDEDGKECNKGEVFIEPPSIGLSLELLNKDHHQVYYADAPQGLRRHGDQVEKLENGYYRILGRADDTMNLNGIKTSSAEIEEVINNLEQVKESAAIAICPKDGGPSQLIIYCVAVGSEKPELSVIQNALKTQLNPLFKAEKLILVDSLPRTASNKIMRRVLRDQIC